jgi:hypothetical protein
MSDTATSPEDARLWVRFHMGSIEDPIATKEAGYPKFKDVPFIQIAVPGDKTTLIDRPVWDDENNPNSDTQRFPAKWAAFKNGAGTDITVGTPLTEWPAVTRAVVDELAHWKIRTVEQLAGLSDSNAQKFMGSLALRQKARDFLEAAKGAAPVAKLRTELEERDGRIAGLEKMLKEQGEKLDQLAKQKQK